MALTLSQLESLPQSSPTFTPVIGVVSSDMDADQHPDNGEDAEQIESMLGATRQGNEERDAENEKDNSGHVDRLNPNKGDADSDDEDPPFNPSSDPPSFMGPESGSPRPETSSSRAPLSAEPSLVILSGPPKGPEPRPSPAPSSQSQHLRPEHKPSTKRPSEFDLNNQSAVVKRVKTSAHTSVNVVRPPPKYSKHPVHWQHDGFVLIQIKRVRFRLIRSRLVKASKWFRDYFERSGPATNGSNASINEEAPLISLNEASISVADFEALLSAMDDAITYLYNDPPFHTIASILRASHTLSFEAYFQWSSRWLQTEWSADLDRFKPNRQPFAAETVALARQCELPKVLKRALYELVRQEGFGQADSDDVEDGSEDENANASGDETDVEGMEDDGNASQKRKKTPPANSPARRDRAQLSSTDYRVLVRAREKLALTWMMAAASPTGPLTSSCAAPRSEKNSKDPADDDEEDEEGRCISGEPEEVPLAHNKIVHQSRLFEKYLYDPICGYNALIESDKEWGEAGYCDQCVERMRSAWRNAREECWANLDVWFGLQIS